MMTPSPQFQNQRCLQLCHSLKGSSSKRYHHSISMFIALKKKKKEKKRQFDDLNQIDS